MNSMVMNRSSPPCHGGISVIRAVMVMVTIVFIGYIFIWVMTPTKVYTQRWLPKIAANTNTTFFGIQGTIILLYIFPIVFIAVLACLYLHLQKLHYSNKTQSNWKKHQVAILWKRPVIIKGLGIVSGIEVAFFVMFIALLVWSFSNYLRASFENITAQSLAEYGSNEVWEFKLGSAAYWLGVVGNICLAFLFFPVTRGSSVLPLLGLTSEASVKYHIWLGHITMILFTTHGVCFVIYWAVTHQLSEMVKWAKVGVSNVAGEMSLVAGLVLWVMTFPRLRRKAFELFFYTHHLYILFMIFYVLHVGFSYTGTMMLPGFYLFVVDRFLRFLQSRQGVRLVSARVLPSETLELNFSKTPDLSYTPTSILFLDVPAISKLQWHPFTISSDNNLEAEIVSVIVKGEGSWTKKLYQMLSSHSPLHHLDVSIEGPYGPFSTYFLRHDALVMVSGGSGITPFISIIRHLIFLSQTPSTTTPPPPAVAILICAFRNSSDLSTLDLLLPISSPPSHHFPNLNLQIQAFVTRETKPTTENRYDHLQHKTRTLWFNPNPSALPFSPVLGSNSWLWLGVIVSSSFVMFLLLMGILTRYYIFPIDRNTNQIYSYSARSALNGLIICASIAGAATAAFYWNKKGGGWREPNQVQNLKGALLPQTAATGTAESWVVNAERELESLPQPSLADFINVHYGARPDLKRILLERRESSTGVLVCGPKEMRHEVARICSSASAQNLHFESISFSW